MRGLGILMAILLAVGLAACGGQTASQPAPQDAVVLAASKTNDAGTYKADMTGTVDAAGQSLEMTGTGEVDAKQQRGNMSMKMSGVGQDIQIEMVYAFPIIYMRFPPSLATGLPAGKSWVKMDLDKLGQQAGIDFGQLMQSAQADLFELRQQAIAAWGRRFEGGQVHRKSPGREDGHPAPALPDGG